MKVKNWCVSANWGIYNHIVRTDCSSYKEAIRVAEDYKDRYERMRRRRSGKAKSRTPDVHVWQLHHSL